MHVVTVTVAVLVSKFFMTVYSKHSTYWWQQPDWRWCRLGWRLSTCWRCMMSPSISLDRWLSPVWTSLCNKLLSWASPQSRSTTASRGRRTALVSSRCRTPHRCCPSALPTMFSATVWNFSRPPTIMSDTTLSSSSTRFNETRPSTSLKFGV